MTTELPAGHPEAIVRPDAAGRRFTVERIAPRDSLAEFVDYYWLVRWHVPGRHRQQVVPQPRVHLAAEQGRLLVHGVTRKPFFRTLEGSGHVLGAAFHAGGFRPLLRASVGGMSLRSLQRLFTEYVGVGPKWVIQRFRILDAVAAAHAGAVTDWAALARELGFSDQAHLTRVFTQVVGTPPASYQREVGSARPPATAGSDEPSRPPSRRPGRAAPGRPAAARGRSPR